MTVKTSRRLYTLKVYLLFGFMCDQMIYLKSFKPGFHLIGRNGVKLVKNLVGWPWLDALGVSVVLCCVMI